MAPSEKLEGGWAGHASPQSLRGQIQRIESRNTWEWSGAKSAAGLATSEKRHRGIGGIANHPKRPNNCSAWKRKDEPPRRTIHRGLQASSVKRKKEN